MARKYVSCKFSERCKAFFRFKGVVQPRCGCGGCWEFYFSKNLPKVMAAAKALQELGEEPVILAQGKDYAYEVEQRETFELKLGLRKGPSDYVAVARNRGQKYVKHLRQWLRDNPELIYATPPLEVAA